MNSETNLAELANDPITKALRGRASRPIVEKEILRVISTVSNPEVDDIFDAARREVLKWARKRSGGELPAEAWEGAGFEALAAGRTTMGAKVETENGLLWSLRADDPDKVVPGRIWSTEVSLGHPNGGKDILLGMRLLVNSTEDEIFIKPSVPGLVLQIAEQCGLRDGPVPVGTFPHFAQTESHVDQLMLWLKSESRRQPIIVATGDERLKYPEKPLIDVTILAKALCGIAHVVFVPASLTYKLSDEFGKEIAVFHGGVRIYNPGFDAADDPRDHRLYLGRTLLKSSDSIVSEIRNNIARESLRRTRLGRDVLPFTTVRSAALRVQQSLQIASGASDAEQLAAANTRNEALELELNGLRAEVDQALELSVEEAARAEDSEKHLVSAWARIEQLESALKLNGSVVDGEDIEPTEWEEFATWCDKRFSSRLSLAPAARRAVRKPDFEDIRLAVECVRWLATEARDRFLSGGGSLANISIINGATNAPCGSDEYYFDFHGRRFLAKWHIKNGGNTRQPERCLRIYYAFDEISRQIIISDMPAHRRTSAT